MGGEAVQVRAHAKGATVLREGDQILQGGQNKQALRVLNAYELGDLPGHGPFKELPENNHRKDVPPVEARDWSVVLPEIEPIR